jgi:DNA repair protein SbcC/Rad50
LIVRRLRIENIRSYRAAEVEFQRGRTLFEGDIGAGKSTILMAIEFALFGLSGSAKAASLLRVGESKGSAELDFESNGVEYSVKRTLAKKAGSIQQVEGKLRSPDGDEDYPASELKEKILGILNFREPTDPKSSSLIYRYAIYTPQEEMKQIIALPSDSRLQILRRAFGVEEYKLAMGNARELLGKVHEKRVRLETASREIPSLKAKRKELEEKAGRAEMDVARLEAEEKEEEGVLQQLLAEREELHEVEVRLARASSDHLNLKARIAADERAVHELTSDVGRLRQKADRLEAKVKALGKAPCRESQEELRATVKALDKRIEEHVEDTAAIRMKMEEFESVIEKGMCPVCEREAKPKDFEEKLSLLSTERRKGSTHLEALRGELDAAKRLLELRRSFDERASREKEDAEEIEEQRREATAKTEKLSESGASLELNKKKLVELESRVTVLEREARRLEPLRVKIESSQRGLKALRDKASGLRSDARKWGEDVSQMGERISRLEMLAGKAMQLGDRELWLEGFFVPTLESIERHVMNSINREFGHSFQRWFGTLVEDGAKESTVDEDFAPVVSQEGYDQDIDFLSGGERTSVALAYRLALSQMVQKYAEAGPSSLILDEPTDGFSKEQLGRMREILDELANPQVIIVSHERELESFADQIYRVVRVDGESKITR